MKLLDTPPALLAPNPDIPGNPAARARARDAASAARRASGPLVRLWHWSQATWLARRLRRVDAELRQWTTREAPAGGSGETRPVTREELAAYEGCRTERAILRARLGRVDGAR